jgi:hypothetical protein
MFTSNRVMLDVCDRPVTPSTSSLMVPMLMALGRVAYQRHIQQLHLELETQYLNLVFAAQMETFDDEDLMGPVSRNWFDNDSPYEGDQDKSETFQYGDEATRYLNFLHYDGTGTLDDQSGWPKRRAATIQTPTKPTELQRKLWKRRNLH